MAEQTLTINTLAATVITPSDVSQFSLDDIAPNIINGGGGTIVDVSGIVTLASQVAELDSEVTVLQTNVSSLQEDVSGLDAAVAQAQTTATSAASTANAAVATANSAKSTAQYALKAGTAQYTLKSSTAQYALKVGTAQYALEATTLKYEDTYGNTNSLKAKFDGLRRRLDFEGKDGDRLLIASAASATSLEYATPAGIPGYINASLSDDQIIFRDFNGTVLSVAGSGSGGGNTATAQYALKAGTAQYALKATETLMASRATALQYYRTDTGQFGDLEAKVNAGQLTFSDLQGNELSVAGSSSGGGGFDGSFVGNVDLRTSGSLHAARLHLSGTEARLSGDDIVLKASDDTLRLGTSTASLVGGALEVGCAYGGNLIYFDSGGIKIGNPDVGSGTALQFYRFNEVSIHPVTAEGIADEIAPYLNVSSGGGGFNGTYTGPVTLHSSTDANKSTLQLTNNDLRLEGVHIRLDAGSKLFIANDAEAIAIGNSTSLKDTILLYAGSGGGSSSTGYPALTAPNSSSLYYGITSPDSPVGFRFGSFIDGNGESPVATLKAFDNSITIESFENNSTILAYGLWVQPGNLRFGVASTEEIDGFKQGVYIPSATGYNTKPMYVGEMPSISQVYGLMAKNSIVGVGNTWYDSSAHVDTGVLVNTDTTLVQAKSSDGEASLLLDASSSIATLSAIFTLNCKETTLGEADWAKLKQLADKADELLALLNQ